jgi:toxin HigB-1
MPYSHDLVIESFTHKGLEEFFSTGRSAKIGAALVKRLTVRLAALHAAAALDELNQPGFDFHPLRGPRPLRYSIHVNGPWCLTFEWSNGRARRVTLEQYH